MWATDLLRRTSVLCALALCTAVAEAQTVRPAPDKLPAWPVITQQDMDRASAAVRMPPPTTAVQSAPMVEALPKPQAQVPIDLQAVAKGFAAAGTARPDAGPADPPLLVFVSFGMPEPSLQRIIEQSERSGATLVLRGLEQGSMQKTVARIQRLIGSRQVGFQIDPQAFERFGVRVVPSFVLATPGVPLLPCKAGQCFANDQFVVTSGDVSIDYALEAIARQAPRFRGQAERVLAKLEAR